MVKRVDIIKKKLWKTISWLMTDLWNEKDIWKKLEMIWYVNDLIEKMLLLEWKATVIKKDIKINKTRDDDEEEMKNINPDFMVDLIKKEK